MRNLILLVLLTTSLLVVPVAQAAEAPVLFSWQQLLASVIDWWSAEIRVGVDSEGVGSGTDAASIGPATDPEGLAAPPGAAGEGGAPSGDIGVGADPEG